MEILPVEQGLDEVAAGIAAVANLPGLEMFVHGTAHDVVLTRSGRLALEADPEYDGLVKGEGLAAVGVGVARKHYCRPR